MSELVIENLELRMKKKTEEHENKNYLLTCALMACALIPLFGCEKAQKREAGGGTKIISEEMELKAQVEQLQKENERLKQENETLSMLPGDKRADAIYKLQRVDIGRFTGIYREDTNSTNESLIVYVQPVDETGDAIKAAGKVEIQLWDLNKPESQSMLGQWMIEPNDLKTMWFDSIASTGYRFKYNMPTTVNAGEPLTVRVTFTDYLSGRVLTEQKTIKQ
jgi:hypothetical protein